MRRRLTRGFLALLLLLMLLPPAGIWYATCTESGLRFVVQQLSRKVGPVTMRIDGGSGTFADGFRIEHFRLLHERVEVRADGVSGRVSVLPLLWATIRGHDVRITNAYVKVLPRLTTGKPLKRFLPPFLSIIADGSRIDSATLIVINGRRFDGTDVVASGALHSTRMRFQDISFAMGELHATAAGTLTAHEPLQLTAESRWTWTTANQPLWIVTADASGDLAKLDIRGQFTSPFQSEFTGAALDLTRNWHWQAEAKVSNLDIRAWGGGGVLGRIFGNLSLSGNKDGFNAHGPLESAGLNAGPFDTRFEGNYADRLLSARHIELVHRESRATVTAAGGIGIVSGGPRLDLKGSWRGFQWPLRGAAALASARGDFTLSGVWPFDVTANGRMQPSGLPEFPMQARGSLAKDHFELREGSAALWGGRANVNGEARWAPQYGWKVSGRVADLDTTQLRADVSGRLSFDISANGDQFSSSTDFKAEMRNLSGRLRGTAARGFGQVQRMAGVWRFDRVNLSAGGTTLAIDGSLGATADLVFKLDATDLSIIAPDMRGRVAARGSVRGTPEQPIMTLVASGSALRQSGVTLRAFQADIDIDTRPGQDLHADVKLQDLGARDRVVNHFDLSLRGRTNNNRLSLSTQAVGTKVNATAEGAFDGSTWRGRWQTLTVDDKADLHLALEAPAALVLGLDAGSIERFCLKGSLARLCSAALWDAQRWSVDSTASELPMSALTAGLTPRVAYEGRLDIQLRAFGNGGGPIEGKLQAELTDAQLRRQRSNSRQDLIRLGTGTVSLTADRDALRGSVNLDARDLGTLSGQLFAQRAGYEFADMPLRASLKAATRELDFINIYVPDVDRAAGKLVADIALGGTVSAPLASGSVQLTDGELDLYQVNLQLRKVGLLATLADNRLQFEGGAQAAEGSLQTTGTVSWTGGVPHGLLRLTGKDLLIVNVPEARIIASPDLSFKLDDHRMDVSGTITVPSARISPADLTGAVLASSDEILVGTKPIDPANRFLVSSSVRMVLGDKVSIDTFGLSGRLTGSIATLTSTDGTSRGTGELNVADGKYAAFGRRLDVERGRLIFSGGLLADPGVDLRATKQFPDVVAGVNVRGTLRQPRMTFFSIPALPQSQIVSLILAGGSLETAQNSAGSGVARSELLAQGGAILAQQLGQRVGVDDVSIEQSLTNETSVVLGKYLSPRLYISYGISLAESINTIKMRYTLGDRWTIKTEVGKERGADLVYTIEK